MTLDSPVLETEESAAAPSPTDPADRLDIVAIAEDWGGHPSSSQHIVGRLAADHNVLWMNSVGMRRPRLNRADMARVWDKVARKIGRRPAVRQAHAADPQPLPARMRVQAPLALPYPGLNPAMALNRRLLGRQLRRGMAAMGLSRPILWLSMPTALPVVGAIGERAVVYYCGDDFGALEGVDHGPVLAMERALAEKADIILAASPVIAERFPSEKTVHLPHGVDFDRFARPSPRAEDLPEGGPIAGFYGAFADWLDKELLLKTALALPEWTFVFIGPVTSDNSALAALPNVRFLGPRPHSALPSYVRHWTASLIPFRDTAQIRASNPLKLREYLAAGTPIAATDFTALAPYRHLVSVVDGPEALVAALNAAPADRVRDAARRAAVAQESWSERARRAEVILEALWRDRP